MDHHLLSCGKFTRRPTETGIGGGLPTAAVFTWKPVHILDVEAAELAPRKAAGELQQITSPTQARQHHNELLGNAI